MNLEDVPAVAEAFVLAFNAAPWLEAWTPEVASICLRDLLALPRASALVAWDGGTCLGAILGAAQRKDTGFTHQVKDLFVRPDAQGRDVGRELIGRHLRDAEERGVVSVNLLTARDTDSEAFYLKSGFRRAGRQIVMVRP